MRRGSNTSVYQAFSVGVTAFQQYVFKILKGFVPKPRGFSFRSSARTGIYVLSPAYRASEPTSLKNMKESSWLSQCMRVFNGLPQALKSVAFETTFQYKVALDAHLAMLIDLPNVKGRGYYRSSQTNFTYEVERRVGMESDSSWRLPSGSQHT